MPAYVTHLEGALNAVQNELLYMLSQTQICIYNTKSFHIFRKHLHDSLYYTYNDPRISYSQLVNAAQGVESE